MPLVLRVAAALLSGVLLGVGAEVAVIAPSSVAVVPATPSPSPIVIGDASPSPAASGDLSPSPAPGASAAPSPTAKPGGGSSATPLRLGVYDAKGPTRVRVAAYGIDLPVVPTPGLAAGESYRYPYCDVAEYETVTGRPGSAANTDPTFVFAHARAGMFGALIVAARANPAGLIGKEVLLWTGDGLRRRYRIARVLPASTGMEPITSMPSSWLVLQTSETDSSTGTKLVIGAEPVGEPVSDPGSARPTPDPRRC
jgi:hypothetical protein